MQEWMLFHVNKKVNDLHVLSDTNVIDQQHWLQVTCILRTVHTREMFTEGQETYRAHHVLQHRCFAFIPREMSTMTCWESLS